MIANLNGNLFFDFYLSKFGGKLVFTSNLARKDAKSLDVKDTFLQDFIELWSDFNYKDSFASQRILVLKSYGITR